MGISTFVFVYGEKSVLSLPDGCVCYTETALMTAYQSNYSNSEEKTYYLFTKLNLLRCLV